ncbi:MAG: hypothetical protein ACH34X_18280 [Thiolinea sp.]
MQTTDFVNGCQAVRLDSGLDTVLYVDGVHYDYVHQARLALIPRGHDGCDVDDYIELLVCGEMGVMVVRCTALPDLAEGRYEGQVQVWASNCWLDAGKRIFLEIGDVELL